MAAPPPPRRPCRRPELMDELVEQIFLRLPPDEPAHLARAALVCKRWCRLVTDPGFRRRYRQFHRTPPMLGLIICSHGRANATHFLPTSSLYTSGAGDRLQGKFPCGGGGWSPIDVRHGRILFCNNPVMSNPLRMELKVWTLDSDVVHKLPIMVQVANSHCAHWNAVVLCAAPGCDHMECPSDGPFTVVVVGRTMFESSTKACVYSSATGEWSRQAFIELTGYVEQRCNASALVGNALYFLLKNNNGILEYDSAKKELSSSVTRLPPICGVSTTIVLMSVEDGRLGFAMVHDDDFSLSVWLRESALTPSGGWTWTQHRVVDLKSFLPDAAALSRSPYILAAADAVGVFVVRAAGRVFAIDLKSGRVREIKVSDADGRILNILPYISFCTPSIKNNLHR